MLGSLGGLRVYPFSVTWRYCTGAVFYAVNMLRGSSAWYVTFSASVVAVLNDLSVTDVARTYVILSLSLASLSSG